MDTDEGPRVGLLLREWRRRRGLSQLDLALRAGSSTRHLSYVENGRARPGREMVLRLAEHLDIPLRDRNGLLLAAGYAPAYRESPLDSERMAMVRSAVKVMLTGHEPFPAVAIDRIWNIVASNDAMNLLLGVVPPHLTESGGNVMRLILHPEGLASRCLNFAQVRAHALGRLKHQVNTTGHRDLRELYEEVSGYPDPPDLDPDLGPVDPTGIVVPLRIRTPLGDMAFLSTIATFGAPADVTLSELAVESFFPMDDQTDTLLRALAGRR
ncbi:helix-turn-helix transcriptional regulator [Streptomyces sp. C11-1]|uniref:Helix-turn-helix transcriptional regulator n=1 Tax=Streptomyces durocortorensis TaxID=2811104 RepID=A0ABY9W3T1_9ACTN|nr:helix-turn-helix transcriptional regulator [Streptomyces durocortorensis]WNF30134.1 helix-turn-helix transcriptional regulator [Streptomyces durocortorensis]